MTGRPSEFDPASRLVRAIRQALTIHSAYVSNEANTPQEATESLANNSRHFWQAIERLGLSFAFFEIGRVFGIVGPDFTQYFDPSRPLETSLIVHFIASSTDAALTSIFAAFSRGQLVDAAQGKNSTKN